MDTETKPQKKNRNLKWYELLIAATVIYAIGVFLGGSNSSGGAIVSVGAYIVFLIALVNAARQGLKGGLDAKPSTGNRIGAFMLALVITFLILGFGAQINMVGESDDTSPSSLYD